MVTDTLKAGRELDELVASLFEVKPPQPTDNIYVLVDHPQPSPNGWWLLCDIYGETEYMWLPKAYSIDPAAAAAVVDEVTSPGGVRFTLRGSASCGNWRAMFIDHRVVPNVQRSGEGNTIALAIALASVAEPEPWEGRFIVPPPLESEPT